MPVQASSQSTWDTRIARAQALADVRPAAREALTFFAALAQRQKALVEGEPSGSQTRDVEIEPRSLIEALDFDSVLDAIPDFLFWLSSNAPAPLRDLAASLRGVHRADWRHGLHLYLASDGRNLDDPAAAFVMQAVVQPFAERCAMRSATPSLETRCSPSRCPFCGALPVVGVLREESHGARRTLVCSLCLSERDYLRVVCPSCGEQEFDALPIYTADRFEHVRIDACDRCRHYLKTIDLTKDGLAVPLVDDIASVSLDLWARDRAYVRLRANVLAL
jgi:formate dehydrogenase accessory protein FdhE